MDSILNNGPLSLPLQGLGPALHEMGAAVTIMALVDAPEFFRQTRELTLEFLDNAVAEEIIDEMLQFQQMGLPVWNQAEIYQASFDHDWLAYATETFDSPLERRRTVLQYQPPDYVRVPSNGEFVTIHLACLAAGISTGKITRPVEADDVIPLEVGNSGGNEVIHTYST